jgi:hypothetical protein
LWTLGSVLYFRGDYSGAAVAFQRAARWGTTAKPLYEAQLLLARSHGGASITGLPSIADARQALEGAPCGQGYGRFVLGELAHRQGDWAAAREYLEEFVSRLAEGRVALRVGLGAELDRARGLLSTLPGEAAANAPAARPSD